MCHQTIARRFCALISLSLMVQLHTICMFNNTRRLALSTSLDISKNRHGKGVRRRVELNSTLSENGMTFCGAFLGHVAGGLQPHISKQVIRTFSWRPYHARWDQESAKTFRFSTHLPDVTMSAFLKTAARNEAHAWGTWNAYPEHVVAFGVLSDAPSCQEVKAAMSTIERLTILIYDRTICHMNEILRQLFIQKGRRINHIPLSRAAVLEHTRRVARRGSLLGDHKHTWF